MKIAVIPARSGSVELPNKNLQVVCRKSLLNRAIDFAIEADLFDKVIVTTDYSTHLFQNDRVDVHHRPESLATSQATMVEVLTDVIEAFQLDSKDKIILLQPTSPYRSKEYLVKVLKLMEQYDSVITVKEVELNPALFVTPLNKTELLSKQVEANQTNRQIHQKQYYPNGNLFGVTVGAFLKSQSFYGGKLGYVLQQGKYNIDINTKEDLKLADLWGQMDEV